MQNYSGSFTTPIVIIVLAAVAVIALGVWAVLGAECLTKEQARAKWPKDVLYWHTTNKCWDNISLRKAHVTRQAYSVNRNPMQLGKPPVDGNGSQARHGGRPIIEEPKPNVAYPALIAGGGTSSNMLTPYVMRSWLPIADFDTDPPAFIPWQQRVVSQLQKE